MLWDTKRFNLDESIWVKQAFDKKKYCLLYTSNNVNLAQNIIISGLNHNYTDPNKTIISQGVNTSEIIIEDDVWIGANSVILAGITIGKHSVIGAGSIIIRDIPPYSIVVGNPGKIIKQYNFSSQEWTKL